jgi:hypothetical protein
MLLTLASIASQVYLNVIFKCTARYVYWGKITGNDRKIISPKMRLYVVEVVGVEGAVGRRHEAVADAESRQVDLDL